MHYQRHRKHDGLRQKYIVWVVLLRHLMAQGLPLLLKSSPVHDWQQCQLDVILPRFFNKAFLIMPACRMDTFPSAVRKPYRCSLSQQINQPSWKPALSGHHLD